jgi:hypothetical protein
MAKQVEVRLLFVKSTPGTHDYGTSDSASPTKQLYLSKDSPLFEGDTPQAITVTIKAE